MITDSQLNGYAERVLSFMQNSSDVGTIHLQLLSHTVKNDHIIEMFLSKLDLYDKVRVMYYTYFLSKGYKFCTDKTSRNVIQFWIFGKLYL